MKQLIIASNYNGAQQKMHAYRLKQHGYRPNMHEYKKPQFQVKIVQGFIINLPPV